MNLCFSCYEKEGLDKMTWERVFCDETYKKACSTCSLAGKFVRNIIKSSEIVKKKKEKKEKKKKVAVASWNPTCGHRERPEHLWKRMMLSGY